MSRLRSLLLLLPFALACSSPSGSDASGLSGGGTSFPPETTMSADPPSSGDAGAADSTVSTSSNEDGEASGADGATGGPGAGASHTDDGSDDGEAGGASTTGPGSDGGDDSDGTAAGGSTTSTGDTTGGAQEPGVLEVTIFADDTCEIATDPASITVPLGTEFTVRWINAASSDVEVDVTKIDAFNAVPIILGLPPGDDHHDDIRQWCGELFTGTFSFRIASCYEPHDLPVNCGG